VVDVVVGISEGQIVADGVRENEPRLPVIPNLRVAAHYAAGTLAAIGVAVAGWPWTGILLWPALSLGIVAAGYAGLGPAIYRKSQGCLPLSSRLLLAPCLLGQYLSLRHYRRQCDAWSELTPRVWIGARLSQHEAADASRRAVTAVLDLTAEFSEAPAFLQCAYRNVPNLDLTGFPAAQLQEAVDFITRHARNGVVYVHCKAGYSRTAAAAGAWLLASGQVATVEQAVARLRKVRPSIVIRPEASAALALAKRWSPSLHPMGRESGGGASRITIQRSTPNLDPSCRANYGLKSMSPL
jgi:protein phosphatase